MTAVFGVCCGHMIRKGCDCVVSGREVWKGYKCASHVTMVFVKTTILSGGYRGGGVRGVPWNPPLSQLAEQPFAERLQQRSLRKLTFKVLHHNQGAAHLGRALFVLVWQL